MMHERASDSRRVNNRWIDAIKKSMKKLQARRCNTLTQLIGLRVYPERGRLPSRVERSNPLLRESKVALRFA